MVTTALAEVKGLVDPRFLLTAFFPVLIFGLAYAMLLASTQRGPSAWIDTWDGWSGSTQAVAAIGVLVICFVLATFASSNGLLLTRLYEGYLGPDWLRHKGEQRQERRRNATHADVELRFPHDNLRPTALGNVLGAAEDYPRRAYGTDAIVTWPRLFLLLPEEFVLAATGPLDTIQFLLLASLLSTVLAVLGGVLAIAFTLGATIFLAAVVGGALLAHLAYRGAVEAAIEYGLHVRAAFDLHRNELLAQLNRPAPTTSDEELRVWSDVNERLRRGERRPVRYLAAKAK